MVRYLAVLCASFILWGKVTVPEKTEIYISTENVSEEGNFGLEKEVSEERSFGSEKEISEEGSFGEEMSKKENAEKGISEEKMSGEETKEEMTEGKQAFERVTLSFAGDISFAEGYANMVSYHSRGNDIAQCITPDLIARMDSADIMMVNNEFTYSNRGAPLSGKTFTFRAKPEMAENLLKLSVDIVSLANNHVFDYGETALIDTLDTLDHYEIPYVGAGRNLEEAKKIVYMEKGGMKIAFVSATQVERSYVFTKEATDSSAGVLRTFSPEAFLEVIRRAEETSDFVVVYVHWGTEGVNQFEGDQQLLGHQYIDAGADLVIGDHPHCLQGVEYYKGVPIFYSLGNYWFNSRTLDTGLVEADICRDGLLELRFVPCLQQNCRTSLVTDPAQQQRVFRFLESISANASVDELGVIREK